VQLLILCSAPHRGKPYDHPSAFFVQFRQNVIDQLLSEPVWLSFDSLYGVDDVYVFFARACTCNFEIRQLLLNFTMLETFVNAKG
jgi:hypothetical protein